MKEYLMIVSFTGPEGEWKYGFKAYGKTMEGAIEKVTDFIEVNFQGIEAKFIYTCCIDSLKIIPA